MVKRCLARAELSDVNGFSVHATDPGDWLQLLRESRATDASSIVRLTTIGSDVARQPYTCFSSRIDDDDDDDYDYVMTITTTITMTMTITIIR